MKEFEAVVYLCRLKQVSFSLHYEECANTWYFEVSSAATEECTASRSSTYENTLEELVAYLEKM